MPRQVIFTPSLPLIKPLSPMLHFEKDNRDPNSAHAPTVPIPINEWNSAYINQNRDKKKIAARVNRALHKMCGLDFGPNKAPLYPSDESTIAMIRMCVWMQELPIPTDPPVLDLDYHYQMTADKSRVANRKDVLKRAIGVLVNGAARIDDTVDVIHCFGEVPLKMVDLGCLTDINSICEAIRSLTIKKDKVSAIIVNIFGGIMRCDVIAQGIIQAAKELDLKIPIVVRLQGTKVEDAKSLIATSQLRIFPCDNLNEAAKMVVKLSNIVDLGPATNNDFNFELSI
ncbi:unnamed protein product [Caenorhabditis brenneri]